MRICVGFAVAADSEDASYEGRGGVIFNRAGMLNDTRPESHYCGGTPSWGCQPTNPLAFPSKTGGKYYSVHLRSSKWYYRIF